MHHSIRGARVLPGGHHGRTPQGQGAPDFLGSFVLFFFGCCPSFFDHFFLLILVLLVSLLFYLHLSSLSFLPSFFPLFLSFFLLPLLLSFFLACLLAFFLSFFISFFSLFLSFPSRGFVASFGCFVSFAWCCFCSLLS
jgi:hypothetical protein